MSQLEDGIDADEGLDDMDGQIAVGRKVIEMADRVKVMHAAIPGARATWHFEIDDVRYHVAVTVVDPST